MEYLNSFSPKKIQLKPRKQTVAFLLAFSKSLATVKTKNQQWVLCKN